eukprot:1630904-Pyramimonas_sp.AAC.1
MEGAQGELLSRSAGLSQRRQVADSSCACRARRSPRAFGTRRCACRGCGSRCALRSCHCARRARACAAAVP